MRRGFALRIGLAGLFASLLATPAAGQVTPACSTLQVFHIGHQMTPVLAASTGRFYEGNRAIINVPDLGTFCTGSVPQNWAYSWAMVNDDDYEVGGWGWAQAGWYTDRGGAPFHLSQSVGANASTLLTRFGYQAAVNTAYSYRVEYTQIGTDPQWGTPIDGLQMRVGTDVLQNSLFNPYCPASCGGWGVNSGRSWVTSWQSEVFYPESNIPGTTAKPMNFTGIETQTCCNDTWETNFQTATNITPNNARPGVWHVSPFTNRSFSVWRGLPRTTV